MAHGKHSKLNKPERGFFSRNEISILGSNCSQIKTIAIAIGENLKDSWDIIYADAAHSKTDDSTFSTLPFSGIFTDKIHFSEYRQFGSSDSNSFKNFFYNTASLTLINGNHFRGNKQIVIIDPKKEASLVKRKENLTEVVALVGEDQNIPDYIKSCIPNFNEIPFFHFNSLNLLSSFLNEQLTNQIPVLHGLILTGGISSRMGKDKSMLIYHGQPQHNFLFEMLQPLCKQVFVSCRENQMGNFKNPMEDKFLGLGPMGGLLTAFQANPNVAWLTVACDIPLLNSAALQKLIKSRNPNKIATCFYNSQTDFPEPLITIWEPKAYSILLEYLSQGYSCPRKVLINSTIELVRLSDDRILFNANDPSDAKKAVKFLSKNQ